MIVGCLGDISFAVFDSHVETIKNMVQNVSARYTTHQRAGGPALTEFTGTDAQTITFDIELAAYLGVNPKSGNDCKNASSMGQRCRSFSAMWSMAAIGGLSNL